MTTHIRDATRSHSAVVTQQKQSSGYKDSDLTSAAMPASANSMERRSEARMDYRCLCSYEALKVLEGESAVIEQGTAFALNRSTEGMLLFLALVPHAKQLIEVHTFRFGWSRIANVFEVRWARPVQVESFGTLYVVGCRRMFGLRDNVVDLALDCS